MPASVDFWYGNLAMTVACATKHDDPRPLLKSALREFLADHPPGSPLGDMLRAELKGK
jgi:hypothetical protein